MNVIFPVIELVDRFCIAKLKQHKTANNLAELNFYQEQLTNYNLTDITTDLDELYNVHATIWELEAALKAGLEDDLSLEEIGRRAIEIRNWNHRRIELKNIMADKLGQEFIHEFKKDHLSE